MSHSDIETPFVVDEDLVQSPAHKAAETGSIDFDGLLQTGLLLHQDLTHGNGGQAWPAGVVLTKYLLRRKRDELQNSTMSVFNAC
jgi:protein N-lysine methyltransferase METTL21A